MDEKFGERVLISIPKVFFGFLIRLKMVDLLNYEKEFQEDKYTKVFVLGFYKQASSGDKLSNFSFLSEFGGE